MNWLDVIIVASAVIVGYAGYRQGLIGVLTAVVGIVVGVALASRYHSFLGEENWAQVIAFGLVLVGMLIIASLAGAALRHGLNMTRLGFLDKTAGLTLGLVLGLFLCAAILAIMAKVAVFDPSSVLADVSAAEVHHAVSTSQSWAAHQISESYLADLLLGKSALIRTILPGDFSFLKHFFD